MCQGSGVSQIFIPSISNEEKILGNANAVVRKQVKRENSSLPVAVRVSKTCVLKLPNILRPPRGNYAPKTQRQAGTHVTKTLNVFCLHYTTEQTQRLRHGRVGQPGPRYVLIATPSSEQSR